MMRENSGGNLAKSTRSYRSAKRTKELKRLKKKEEKLQARLRKKQGLPPEGETPPTEPPTEPGEPTEWTPS
jgi:hypothetical protein